MKIILINLSKFSIGRLKIGVLPLIMTFFYLTGYGQQCDCKKNFEWVKTTFEKNDAGFSFVLENKGEKAYEQHNRTFSNQISKVKKFEDCVTLIRAWLKYFREGHLSIRILNNKNDNVSRHQNNAAIRERYKNWPQYNIDSIYFTNYINTVEDTNFEGIWVNGNYRVGVKKVEDTFIGFILKADGVYWKRSQIKFKILKDGSIEYFMRDHSKENFENAKLFGSNYLKLGPFIFERIAPVLAREMTIDRYFKSITSRKPYFEQLNRRTSYIRIPSFASSEKYLIDSIILSNKESILATENLIIDIRNNGGGSDSSYKELLPLIYTNPIRINGVEMLSTKLNNQRMLDFIEKPEYNFDDEGKKWAKASYQKLAKNIGKFINLRESAIREINLDTVYPYPKNVGILINERNGSTAEQFLLASKQSKKVKLFGRPTMGVLDISNMYFVKSPCNKFELGYSLSRSLRIPDMAIDGIGIQPDFYIDNEIKGFEWTDYVIKTLN